MSGTDEYKVGYGKPPKHTQFRKGQSPNPNGRPKYRKAVATIAQDMLNEKIDVKVNGTRRKITRAEAIMMRLMHDAIHGSSLEQSRALKSLAAYVPDFHLPVPDEDVREITVRFVESDNFGGLLKLTAEEKLAAKKWLLDRREREKAALRAPGGEAPDPLDM